MTGRFPPDVLGAVLAGGQSTRFGSDKALAALGGRTLLERAVAALAAVCEEVVVVGREQAPVTTVPDRPGPALGPLGGLAGALAHARETGRGAVLTAAVDSFGLDAAALTSLAPGPAFCASQPVIGLWPVDCLEEVEAILAGPQPHSLRRLAAATGAREVGFAVEPGNVNTPADLAAAERDHDD